MTELRMESLAKVLEDSSALQQGLLPFLQEIDSLNMEVAFNYIGIIARNLSQKTSPKVKINSLTAAIKMFEVGNYPCLLLAEIYLLPKLQKMLSFAKSNPNVHRMMNFFEEQGYNFNIPNLQNMSFNFVTVSCQLVELGAIIKPLKVYQGRQYSDSSLFRKQLQRLNKSGYQREKMGSVYKFKEANRFRQKYVHSLSRWEQFQQNFIMFYVQILDCYLDTGFEPKHYQLSFIDSLKYGQPTITSEVIARLVQIIAYCQNFRIRTRALKLFDSLILWGDIEALLVSNHTEHVQLVIKNIWNVEGQKGLSAGKDIYPEVEGQEEQKKQFYTVFLRCIQAWSQSFPTNEYLSRGYQQKEEHSAVYKLYRLLKDKKRFVFPPNIGIPQYQKQSHKNMHDKMIRNEMILADINSQEEGSQNSILVCSKTFQQVLNYYQMNKKLFMELLSQSEEGFYERMRELTDFRNNFEDYVQTIDVADEADEDIDKLIENGLELIDLINAIQLPYIEFLKRQHTFLQLKEIMTKIYIEYEHPSPVSEKVKPILSERLKARKQELKSLLKYQQRSIPLWKQLREIVETSSIRELRSKYRQRLDKLHSSQHSESSMNLQIYTKAIFSSESREERLMRHNFDRLNELSRQEKQKEEKKPEQIAPKDATASTKSSKDSGNKKNSRNKIMVVSRQFKKEGLSSSSCSQSRNNSHPKEQNSPENEEANTTKKEEVVPVQKSDKIPCQHHFIPFEQNNQYFQDINCEHYKFSYIYAHIIIFNSSYLTVQRIVSQRQEADSKIKVLIQLILIPHQPLHHIRYSLQNQQCIELEDISVKLPEVLVPDARYCITLLGLMKKIPLKLPTIGMFMNGYPLFQYILPFTIHFFLKSCPYQNEVLEKYYVLTRQSYKCFESAKIKLSPKLFSRDNLGSMAIFFPSAVRLVNDRCESFLWQVGHETMTFFIFFEYERLEERMMVSVFAPTSYHQSYNSFFSYIGNCLAHMLAHFE